MHALNKNLTIITLCCGLSNGSVAILSAGGATSSAICNNAN